MRELGLSLTPPPQVDFDSVPLERLLPVRTPRAGGLTGTLASHQVSCLWGGVRWGQGSGRAVLTAGCNACVAPPPFLAPP